ncbi:MAG: sugar ABC transporter permease [Deinococcales bacterium]
MDQAHRDEQRPERRRGRSLLARMEERTAILLLVPSFLILILIAFYPFGQVIYSSLTSARFASDEPTRFVGLQNYQKLLSITIRELPLKRDANGDVVLRDGVKQYESWVRVLPRPNNPGRGAMRSAILVPRAVITAVSARIWEWMLQPSRAGLFNTVFSYLGINDGSTNFFGDRHLQLPSMIVMDVWKTTPFMALLLLAGLATIPSELYEAAEVDGASKIRQFFSVTLPLLSPTLAVALIFRTLDSLRVFDIFQIVLGNQRFSMASYTQYLLIGQRELGMSSAASVVIFVLIFAFAILYIRTLGVDTE